MNERVLRSPDVPQGWRPDARLLASLETESRMAKAGPARASRVCSTRTGVKARGSSSESVPDLAGKGRGWGDKVEHRAGVGLSGPAMGLRGAGGSGSDPRGMQQAQLVLKQRWNWEVRVRLCHWS